MRMTMEDAVLLVLLAFPGAEVVSLSDDSPPVRPGEADRLRGSGKAPNAAPMVARATAA
jgi:hypothetical protein